MSPERQANPNFSWGDLVQSMVPGGGFFDLFGGGQQTTATPSNPQPSYETPDFGPPSNPDPQPSYETPDFGSGFSTPSYEYNKGGTVRGLIGPNPPGPDDGFGGLQRGEFVVQADEARKHRGLLHAINKGKLSRKKARGLLD
jgi:hypothetical protein